MRIITRIALLLGVLAVAACAGTSGQDSPTTSNWKLEDVSVRFGPEISRTADGNTFSDNFVWNGLNEGNRKKQVVALFKLAMNDVGEQAMTGARPVKMSVQVNYFHALTQYSRLWCCGAHRIFADLTVTDAESGEVLASGENLRLGRVALGGIPGLVAEAAGRDQWTRVREGIADNTLEWLATY